MKINYVVATPNHATLEEFCDEHGFDIEVTRNPDYHISGAPARENQRFTARIPKVEVKEGWMLTGLSGTDASPGDAIRALASAMQGRTLVRDAMSPTLRLEVRAPAVLVFAKSPIFFDAVKEDA